MGCFNMCCVATGVPITVGTPVVMFDLCGAYPYYVQEKLGIDMFGDQMAVMSMPRFGLYNDYGNIENEEDNGWNWINVRLKQEARRMTYIPKFNDEHRDVESQEKNYERDHRMFILREAYDLMVEYDNTNHIYHGPEYETYGDKRRAEQETFRCIVEQRDERSQELLKKGADKVYVSAINRMRLDEFTYNGFAMSRQDKNIWLDLIIENFDVGLLYHKYVSTLHRNAAVTHWHVYPSKYGDQDLYFDEINAMRQIGTTYLERIKREIEES